MATWSSIPISTAADLFFFKPKPCFISICQTLPNCVTLRFLWWLPSVSKVSKKAIDFQPERVIGSQEPSNTTEVSWPTTSMFFLAKATGSAGHQGFARVSLRGGWVSSKQNSSHKLFKVGKNRRFVCWKRWKNVKSRSFNWACFKQTPKSPKIWFGAEIWDLDLENFLYSSNQKHGKKDRWSSKTSKKDLEWLVIWG